MMSLSHALSVSIAVAVTVILAVLFLDPLLERLSAWWEGKVDRWWGKGWAGREGR